MQNEEVVAIVSTCLLSENDRSILIYHSSAMHSLMPISTSECFVMHDADKSLTSSPQSLHTSRLLKERILKDMSAAVGDFCWKSDLP